MPKTVAVIDGNSLMHRAYHAVPPTMNAPDGTPTNAVFGFFSMFLKFLDESTPDAVICAFDAGKPSFRIEALEQYKAQRPPMDDELRVQFPVVENLLGAMNIPIVKMPGWEGDDILGTIAARDEALGYATLLLTGDKDACQLASSLTSIVSMKKGVTDIVVMGPAEVEEKYGVQPALIPDYLGLMGDNSDNIPGVPGIGPKNATKLLQAYGSMEGIYQNLDKLKGKQLENVRDNEQAAFLSRQVATIVRDVPLELDLEQVSFPSYSKDAVERAFDQVRFTAHLGHVLKFIGEQSSASQALNLEVEAPLEGSSAQAFLDDAVAKRQPIAVAFAKQEALTLFDEERLVAAFATEDGRAFLEGDDALRAFAHIVREGRFVSVDAKADLHYVYPVDSSEPALVSDVEVLDNACFDLGLAGYVLNSSSSKYGLEQLLERYRAAQLPECSDASDAEKLALRAAAMLELVAPLTEKLEADKNTAAYFDIDLPLVGALTIMERNGVALDVQLLAELGTCAQKQLDSLTERIYELAGENFNIDSPKQLGHILFEVLGLPHKKKTKSGYSTDASVLADLALTHELPALVLKYRELAKIKSTYIDALPPLRRGDGLVHTSFNETVTTTGRLSSNDPNLQNIPVRTEFGRRIRESFVPLGKDQVFVSADYSQIELRLLAHLSADEKLIEAFNSGADFHASTAARVFGVAVEQVTPEMRSRAKAVNFGIVYGQQAFGLAQSLGISIAEAKEMIDRYFEAYPGVRVYLDKTVADAKKNGYAETMYGRRRYIPELAEKNAARRGFGERTAMNHPMQGSAADIIKKAMYQVQKRLIEEGLHARVLIQVHDELDLSVPENELDQVMQLLSQVMEHVADLKVALKVDVSSADNWAHAH